MKKKTPIVILLLLFIGIVTSAYSKDTTQQESYLLKGRIINKVSLTPDCGYFAFGTVIEFEIIKYTDRTYSQDTIGIIFYCPESYGENFFEVGKLYEMEISYNAENGLDWIIPNEKLLEKNNLKIRPWAKKAEKIK